MIRLNSLYGLLLVVANVVSIATSVQVAPVEIPVVGSDDTSNIRPVVTEVQEERYNDDLKVSSQEDELDEFRFLRDGRGGGVVVSAVKVDPSETQNDERSLLPEWLQVVVGETDNDEGITAEASKTNCADQSNCKNCTSHSSMCHWCAHDQACHARGSYYGCAIGASCSDDNNNNNNNNHDNNKTDDDHHCSGHHSCGECAVSSHFCHWCAHDNACHAVGSWYGCVNGVDCYSNDRCQRKESEPINTGDTPPVTKRGTYIRSMLVAFLAVVALVATACFGCVRACRRAQEGDVHELTAAAHDEIIVAEHLADSNDSEPDMTTPLLSGQQGAEEPDNTTMEPPASPTRSVTDPPGDRCDPEEIDAGENPNSVQMVDLEEQPQRLLQQQPSLPSRSRQRVQKQQSRMKCFYSTCTFCYGITLAVLGGLTFGTVRYYPKMVEYNICNDSVAWEKLVESMARMNAAADIQILASVANYNPIDVVLIKGGGSFRHEGNLVGTFDIPPVTVESKSITDILIIAHFAPEKWQALKIGEEYYKGTLVLNVDAAGTIRVPALRNYTFSAGMQNLEVHVSEINGRRLCHCPSWDEAKNNTGPSFLELPPW